MGRGVSRVIGNGEIVMGGPRLLTPTKGLRGLGVTIRCNTSTIFVNKRRCNLHSGTNGFAFRRVGRNIRFTGGCKTGVCIAAGVFTRGRGVSNLRRCLLNLGRTKMTKVVMTSPLVVRAYHHITPRVRIRLDARRSLSG